MFPPFYVFYPPTTFDAEQIHQVHPAWASFPRALISSSWTQRLSCSCIPRYELLAVQLSPGGISLLSCELPGLALQCLHNICTTQHLAQESSEKGLSAAVEAFNHTQWGLQAGGGQVLEAASCPSYSELCSCPPALSWHQAWPKITHKLGHIFGGSCEACKALNQKSLQPHGCSYHRKILLVGLKEKIRPLNHVWTFSLVVCTRIFKTAQKCCYFHKTLLFQEGTLYLCLLTGPPVNVRADLKIKVMFVWKIWTRSLFFVFSVQSSLENSVSTETLKMCAYMHTHN